ncbi:hypothetical protein [Saccharopolyspora kobensis]|nr:hypothetical protein [Saccharopolyspora kobensis]
MTMFPLQQQPEVPLVSCLLDELDRRAKLAELCMNHALEQQRWDLVRRHRREVLVVQAEIRRRLDALEDSPGHVGTRLGERRGDAVGFC